jgi:hypothetical protein
VRLTFVFALCLGLILPLVSSPKETRASGNSEIHVYRRWTQADIVDVCAIHASKYKDAQYIRYFDLGRIPPEERLLALKCLSLALNSFSHTEVHVLPDFVPGTEGAVAFVDISLLRDRKDFKGLERFLKAYEKLGRLGSNIQLYPEPYYHALAFKTVKKVVKQPYVKKVSAWVKVYDHYGRYSWREDITTETRYKEVLVEKEEVKVAQASHLNKGTLLGLIALTKTEFPVFDVRWFWASALSEPRYHELIDVFTVEDLYALAQAYPADKKDVRSLIRGVATRSGVTHRPRRVERIPTRAVKGSGSITKTYDFVKVFDLVRFKSKDPMADLLGLEADAHEYLFHLPNGLQGGLLTDAQDLRIDRALADAALNNRSRELRERQVWCMFSCMDCHLRQKGLILVDEQVRQLFAEGVKILVGQEKDKDRSAQIETLYLFADLNTYLKRDSAVVASAVEACTKAGDGKSISCAQASRYITDQIRRYYEDYVTLDMLCTEYGVSPYELKSCLSTPGLNPVFAQIAKDPGGGDRARLEVGFAQLGAVLYEKRRK